MKSWVDAQLDDPKVARAAFEETFKEYTAAVAERDHLKSQLQTARADALREAYEMARRVAHDWPRSASMVSAALGKFVRDEVVANGAPPLRPMSTMPDETCACSSSDHAINCPLRPAVTVTVFGRTQSVARLADDVRAAHRIYAAGEEPRRFEDLCLLVEQESGAGVYPNGHLSNERREAIKAAASDEYRCGWNDRSMDQFSRDKTLMAQAQSGLSDDVRCLLASGLAFWSGGGKLSLNMNDTWAWACSDLPGVPEEQIVEAARLFRSYGFAGLMYWYTLQPDGPKQSEFHHNNRAVEFVSNEERIRRETVASESPPLRPSK